MSKHATPLILAESICHTVFEHLDLAREMFELLLRQVDLDHKLRLEIEDQIRNLTEGIAVNRAKAITSLRESSRVVPDTFFDEEGN